MLQVRTSTWVVCCLLLPSSGCSIINAQPTWELVKATGAATSYVLAGIPPKAIDTVQHQFDPPKSLCIAFNPDVQSAELVPAIQAALRARQVESRVFDQVAITSWCPAWLHYSAFIEWGNPPIGEGFRPYLSQAWLTIKTADGRVLASSNFGTGGAWDIGKWASTHDKVDAVVNALLSKPFDQSGA